MINMVSVFYRHSKLSQFVVLALSGGSIGKNIINEGKSHPNSKFDNIESSDTGRAVNYLIS